MDKNGVCALLRGFASSHKRFPFVQQGRQFLSEKAEACIRRMAEG
jgi:hypothetical protein